ncbi:hypothetical protein Bbelb_416570 [Branchiostoma belcheri]|nr:hypothetical protein Bbelb_416570 [Branchiostoma belcheri]
MGSNSLRSKNGPPAYQRHMEEVLEGLSHVICEPYMDDTMVHSDTFESHVERNRRVLRRLQEHGCKLKPKKCIMFRRQVRYVGKLVTAEGYTMDPEDTAAVNSLRGENTYHSRGCAEAAGIPWVLPDIH